MGMSPKGPNWHIGVLKKNFLLEPSPATQQSPTHSNTSVHCAQLGSSSAVLLGRQPQSPCTANTMPTGGILFNRLNQILTGVSPQPSYQLKQALAHVVSPL
jgi:hypothetical protein